MKLALLLAGILVLVVLGLLFRLQVLTAIFSGSSKRPIGVSNKVNALLMPVFLVLGGGAFVWSFLAYYKDTVIPVASVHGVKLDSMFWLSMGIIMIALVITQILLFVYAYKYQHQEGKRAYFFPHNNKVEIIWTTIPAVVMAILIFNGWKQWADITGPAPKDSVVLEVMGKQFNWMVRYPGADAQLGNLNYRLIDATNEWGFDFNDKHGLDDFTPREIHLPKGRPVLVRIRARDVIHGMYMPHFRAQMYAVPGMPTQFWFTPTKTTEEMRTETGNANFNYELACSQICGRGHFAMKMAVIVDDETDYAAWVAQQKSFTSEHPEVMANLKPTVEPAVTQAQTTATKQAAAL